MTTDDDTTHAGAAAAPSSPRPSPRAAAARAIAETATPILEIGRAWMMAPATAERGAELGLTPPFGFWVNGRAGVLGDADADVAAAAIGFMGPEAVRRFWASRPPSTSSAAATAAYAAAAAAWGRRAFDELPENDLIELDRLARSIADGADASVGVLFSGWRALPVPADPAGAATLTLNVLRELRGGAHLSAVQACGIGPVGAIMAAPDPVRGGAVGAERFGWPAPYPSPQPDKRLEAERLTSEICLPAYASLEAVELDRFTELVLRARQTMDH